MHDMKRMQCLSAHNDSRFLLPGFALAWPNDKPACPPVRDIDVISVRGYARLQLRLP